MPEPIAPLLEALGNASGWAVAVAVLLLVVYGFWRGHIVPGPIHEREKERGDRAEDAVDASTKSVDTAAAAAKAATDAAITVAGQLAELQRSVSRLHHPDTDADR